MLVSGVLPGDAHSNSSLLDYQKKELWPTMPSGGAQEAS